MTGLQISKCGGPLDAVINASGRVASFLSLGLIKAKGRQTESPKRRSQPAFGELRRQLTLPLPPGEFERQEQRTADQGGSQFFQSFPKEIRLLIYEFVLGGNCFHFEKSKNSDGPVHGFLCEAPWVLDRQGHGECQTKRRTFGELLPLVMSCRQIYSEAIGFFFTSNIFSFSNRDSFINFSSEMLQRKFESIQHIELLLSSFIISGSTFQEQWKNMWKYFAKTFSHLRVLSLRINIIKEGAKSQLGGNDGDCTSWLIPVAETVDAFKTSASKTKLQLIIPCGYWIYDNRMPGYGHRINSNPTILIDVSEALSSPDRKDDLIKLNTRIREKETRVLDVLDPDT